jgi:hypothetical protein
VRADQHAAEQEDDHLRYPRPRQQRHHQRRERRYQRDRNQIL